MRLIWAPCYPHSIQYFALKATSDARCVDFGSTPLSGIWWQQQTPVCQGSLAKKRCLVRLLTIQVPWLLTIHHHVTSCHVTLHHVNHPSVDRCMGAHINISSLITIWTSWQRIDPDDIHVADLVEAICRFMRMNVIQIWPAGPRIMSDCLSCVSVRALTHTFIAIPKPNRPCH